MCLHLRSLGDSESLRLPYEFGKNRLDLGGNLSEDCLAFLGEVEHLAVSVGAA